MSQKRAYRLGRQGNLLFCRAAVGREKDLPLLLKLLVDTGSSFTVLPTRILQRIGCNLDNPVRTMTNVAASGIITAPVVVVPWFNCLGVKKENFPVVALDLPARTYQLGLLGMDFLQEIKAVIDVAKGEVSVN